MLVIYWKSGPSKGFSDLYPSDWFAAEGEWTFRSHEVKGPKQGLHPARCSLSVRGNTRALMLLLRSGTEPFRGTDLQGAGGVTAIITGLNVSPDHQGAVRDRP